MKLYKCMLWGAAFSAVLTGCIDDKYDLANVNTESEFKVNDLTIPLNLEPVVLDSIIKVKEGDQLKKYELNGHVFYAVEQNGNFNSEPIDVAQVTTTTPELDTSEPVFDRPKGPLGMRARKNADGEITETYTLDQPISRSLEYNDDNVSGSVVRLDKLFFEDLSFLMEVEMKDKYNIKASFSEIDLVIPPGLDLQGVKVLGSATEYTYDKASGALSIMHAPLVDGQTTIDIISTALDIASLENNPYTYDAVAKKGKFDFNASFNIISGNLDFTATPEALLTLPEQIGFTVNYKLASLVANRFSGEVAYDIEGTEIDPVDMENLPDFLDDPETNLTLSNPQIWFQLENPIAKYGLKYEAMLSFTPVRNGVEGDAIVSPLIVALPKTGKLNYLLSPNNVTDPSYIPSDYADNLKYEEFAGLSNILSGKGLPQQLNIKVPTAQIPTQPVTEFELGTDIDGMEGSYTFIAPLSLKEGSKIVKTVDGWWTEDLADLNIDKLIISADAINGLSTGVLLTVFAIDRDGNRISNEGSLELPYRADNEHIEISLTGLDGNPIRNLDGVKLYVIAGENDGQALAPDQTITLNNLSATVTGNYTKKL